MPKPLGYRGWIVDYRHVAVGRFLTQLKRWLCIQVDEGNRDGLDKSGGSATNLVMTIVSNGESLKHAKC